MFDWFWEFLYGISKSLLRLIDGLIACTNKLCGIETVNIGGTETDLISFLLRSDALANGFKIAAVLGFVVLVFFTIFRIILVCMKSKQEISPAQVAGKAFKALLLFFFVPLIMLTLVWALNTLMNALYQATMNGSQGLGTFLFGAFSQDAIESQSVYNEIMSGYDLYLDTDLVASAIDISDFDFIFSWITGICLLLVLTAALIQFVDRAISIGVLFLVSPFSIASSVLDDGGRFKLWREQLLLKFISGYGIILYLNIYCLLISLIMPSNVIFFENTFLNNIFKLLIIIGGGFAMQRASALIGNLVGPGAGSRELMDSSLGRLGAAAAMGGLKLLGKGVMAGGKKLFGGKTGGKAEGKEDSKGEGNGDESKKDDGNSGDGLDANPKYGNSDNVQDKLKNNDNPTPGNNANGGETTGGGSREADVNNFNFGKEKLNEMTADQITQALTNEPSPPGGLDTISEASEEEENED